MKFKGTIVNEGPGLPHQVSVLHVLQALQRLDRSTERRPSERKAGNIPSVVVKITPEAFAFCHRGGMDEGTQTWSHFTVRRLFQEFRIESKRNNNIDLEAPIANLLHVFSSCATSERTTIRLANGRDGRPVLGFEFSLAGNATDHKVDQEVPVRVLADAEAELIREPSLPEPEYQIEIPGSISRMHKVIERMRQVGATMVTVEAAKDHTATSGLIADSKTCRASLRLLAYSELVEVATTFRSLSLVMESKKNESPEGPITLQLSLKRLTEVLAAVERVNASAHIACILEGRALVLYALLPSGLGSLISYTPVISF